MEDLAQILLQGPNVLCFIQQFGTSRRVNGKCTMSFKGLGPFFHVPNLIVLDAIQERQWFKRPTNVSEFGKVIINNKILL
jgi:hypothetical protein